MITGETFVTSDLHFCHHKTFLYEPRGFTSVEEMNETIVEKWNSVVHKGDIVFNLGDICLSDTEAAIPYIRRLNGFQWWIRGNHDTDGKIEKIIKSCDNIALIANAYSSWAYVLKYMKWRFYLCHYPTRINNYDDNEKENKHWCLCGHTHTKDKWLDIQDKCYHVEMDAHDCYPVNVEQIIEDIRMRRNYGN